MLTALTHLSRSPLEQNIIQPLVLSLLHLCRNVVNMPPGNSQPRGDFSITAFVTGFRIIMPSRSPARAWRSSLISRPIIRQNCSLSIINAFYLIRALGANGEGEDDFGRNIICQFMKWHSVVVFRIATIFVAFSGVSLADGGRAERPFSGLTSEG